MCAAGFFSRIERRISAVVHDLPVPVVPRMAKCLPSSSSTRTMAGIVLSWRMEPTRTDRAVVAAEGEFELSLRGDAHAIAERGVDGDAAIECRRVPVSLAFHSSPTRPSSAIQTSLSPSRCAGTGTLSAETIASTVVLAVSMASSVPISGRSLSERMPAFARRRRAARWPWSRSPTRCGRWKDPAGGLCLADCSCPALLVPFSGAQDYGHSPSRLELYSV